MMKQHRFFFFSFLAAFCLLFSGCAFNSQPAAVLYDLGPAPFEAETHALPAEMPRLLVSQVNAADWLNSSKMYYRLAQVNDQQTWFYTLSRWNTRPSKLFSERFQSALLASGSEVENGMAAPDAWRVTVHIEDFSQYFYDASKSEGRIVLRVSVAGKNGRLLQKRFLRAEPAMSPDAAGGAAALAAATDGIIADILQWVGENCRRQAGDD